MKNKLAGVHPSYKKRKMTPEQIKKKRLRDKKYAATPERIKYRTELNKKNRELQKNGKAKVGDKKDVSHTKKGTLVLESQKANRARNRGKK